MRVPQQYRPSKSHFDLPSPPPGRPSLPGPPSHRSPGGGGGLTLTVGVPPLQDEGVHARYLAMRTMRAARQIPATAQLLRAGSDRVRRMSLACVERLSAQSSKAVETAGGPACPDIQNAPCAAGERSGAINEFCGGHGSAEAAGNAAAPSQTPSGSICAHEASEASAALANAMRDTFLSSIQEVQRCMRISSDEQLGLHQSQCLHRSYLTALDYIVE